MVYVSRSGGREFESRVFFCCFYQNFDFYKSICIKPTFNQQFLPSRNMIRACCTAHDREVVGSNHGIFLDCFIKFFDFYKFISINPTFNQHFLPLRNTIRACCTAHDREIVGSNPGVFLNSFIKFFDFLQVYLHKNNFYSTFLAVEKYDSCMLYGSRSRGRGFESRRIPRQFYKNF